MGLKIRWSEHAVDELCEALAFIASDNKAAAQKLSAEVRVVTGRLRLYPMKGRMVPERKDPSLREVIVGPFRIIYSIREPSVIRILAAIRAERSLPNDLG